jgi:glucose/mannose-6-phosphate isomerase
LLRIKCVNRLLKKENLDKIDLSGMYKVYDIWPKIASDAYATKYKKIKYMKIKHIVFAGMGGSGAIGDFFAAILSKTNIHVDIVKGYILPKTVDKNSLVVVTSVSGNTIESISILKASYEKKCKIIAFSNGGEMEKYCNKNKIEFRKIPIYHSPRASFPIYLYSMLKVLKPILPIKDDDIKESLSKMNRLGKKINSKNISKENPSVSLAEWISNIPIIYYPSGLSTTAIRFKNSLQENSKIHAMVEDIIESCHNGVVAWEKNNEIKPILIRGADDNIKTKERWEIIKMYFKKNKIDFKEINSVKGSIISKTICLVYLLDFASIYLSILTKTDPTPVTSIDYIKNSLK